MLSLYVNYRASSFVFCFLFLKDKELLKFESQFLINWFLMCKTLLYMYP